MQIGEYFIKARASQRDLDLVMAGRLRENSSKDRSQA